MKPQELLKPLVGFFSQLFHPMVIAEVCGHETMKEGIVCVGGRSVSLVLPFDEQGGTPYCLDCIGKMHIRCAVCGGVIYVGDPVVLYDRDCLGYVPSHAVPYRHDEQYVIGCLKDKGMEMGLEQLSCTVFSPELSPYARELIRASHSRYVS